MIPADVDTLLDPGWLSRHLASIDAFDRIVAVERVDSLTTIADKLRFAVQVEGPDGERSIPLCAKAHFSNALNSLGTEAHAYRELHPFIPVRTPRAHYVGIDAESDRAMIVMDDVLARGGQILDAHHPYSVDTCRESLTQLALLHATTWNGRRWDVEWLAPRFLATASVFAPDVLQGLLHDGRGEGIEPVLLDAGNLLAAVQRTAELPATCVLHGDTHSGNAFVQADGALGWLDWQITQRGHWSVDVAYHLGTVLDVDTRRAHEAELLGHYLDQLAAAGAPAPSFDVAWEAYAAGFAWGYLLWAITRISSREVVLVHFPRLATAMADHETYARLAVA